MSDQTANLALPFLAAAQAQKHVTVNESLLRLDALVQLSVVSATTAAQPGSPSDGQVYILPSGKTGADWGAMSNGALAYFVDGAWAQITPRAGFIAYVQDADQVLIYSGAAWVRAAPAYDEGAFTPTVSFAAPGDLSVSYATQSGLYTRIGRLVLIDISLVFTPTFTTASGNLEIGGLPFNAANASSSFMLRNLSSGFAWPSGISMVSGLLVAVGGNKVRLRGMGSAHATADIQASHLTSGVAHTVALGGIYNA